ncbi:ABC transporter permease [Helicobacter sp. MIT 05-5293]|uniref:ABC transporter permease n=1 Tax=Helicobacter sp. MIT 05-5293 TaxID=1548149 RepID=UPI00051CEF93|nr:ABC transporter permease [Helicobacter sp. MIT 05-5293]TLD80972.1 ABC transporter permease [Helicobacter sp. MIT 05-5293]
MKIISLRIASVALVIVFLAIWQFLAVKFANPHSIPPFSIVWETFLEMLKSGVLQEAIKDSLKRFVIGLSIGASSAIVIGLILGRYASLEILLEPFIQLFRPISPIAWLPIIVLWLGIGESGAIFVIAYAVFFPVLSLCIAGVRSINPTLLKMAKNFGANERLIFTSIILPGAFLHIASGLKLAASIAWIHLVAGEMLGIQSGLGYLIIDGRNLLQIDQVIVAVIWIGILGYGIYAGFNVLEKWIRKSLGEKND